MRVVLRRRLPEHRSASAPRYGQSVFKVARLSIGRDADQLIQINDPQLAPAHAVIERSGRALWLRTLGGEPLVVNGKPQRRVELRSGDVVQLPGGHLTVEDLRRDGVIVLRLSLSADAVSEDPIVTEAQTLRETGLRSVRSSWLLVVGVLGLTLVAPLLASMSPVFRAPLRQSALLPSDSLWQPGPLHTAHQSIGGNCNACHETPFKRVADQACLTCHRDTQHHVAPAAPGWALFEDRHCTDCHVEHDRPSQLIDTSSSSCVRCHENLRSLAPSTALRNVSDFGTDHPDFSLSMLEPVAHGTETAWRTQVGKPGLRPEEHSNLKFSHRVHLDRQGIKAPDGNQVLECADCHRPEPGGRTMAPIRMQAHCERCHQLLYDEHDPSSTVPHGSLAAVLTALQEHFSRMFLEPEAKLDARFGKQPGAQPRRRPGGEAAILTREEQRRARDWAQRQSLRAAAELLEKRVCVECHTVTHRAGATGFDQWQIEPVKLNSAWMPRAQFDHAAHRSSSCISCHRQADSSRLSGDVLMPAIRDCRSCHAGNKQGGRVASECTMCHRLHLPGRGDFVPPAAQAKVAARSAAAAP